ncbi:MAG: hypothetical protein M3Q60_22705 [Actinomycetota bacterium]|nr:hypothetical protein [Actinomycetota bacterium]
MSRGPGTRMRAVVDRLSADEESRAKGLPLTALHPALGPDRSNGRRVIRSLIRRGAAEWVVDEGGTSRVKLELWTGISAVLQREGRPDECYLDECYLDER